MSAAKNALFYLFVSIVLVGIYLIAIDWIQTEKNFPYDYPTEEFYFFFIQKYAPPECFKIEPFRISYEMKYNSFDIWTYVQKMCNFSQAQAYVYAHDVDFYEIKTDLKLTYGPYNDGININVSGGNMEEYRSYDLKIKYKPSKTFFNRFRLLTEGTSIQQVGIGWNNGIFKGYSCDETCFYMEAGDLKDEEPIFRGRFKLFKFNNANNVVIRFTPKSKFWTSAQTLLEFIILGLVAFTFWEFLKNIGSLGGRTLNQDVLFKVLFLALGFILIMVTILESYSNNRNPNPAFIFGGIVLLFIGGFYDAINNALKTGKVNFELGSVVLWTKIQVQNITDPDQKLKGALGITIGVPTEKLPTKKINRCTLVIAKVWNKLSKFKEIS